MTGTPAALARCFRRAMRRATGNAALYTAGASGNRKSEIRSTISMAVFERSGARPNRLVSVFTTAFASERRDTMSPDQDFLLAEHLLQLRALPGPPFALQCFTHYFVDYDLVAFRTRVPAPFPQTLCRSVGIGGESPELRCQLGSQSPELCGANRLALVIPERQKNLHQIHTRSLGTTPVRGSLRLSHLQVGSFSQWRHAGASCRTQHQPSAAQNAACVWPSASTGWRLFSSHTYSRISQVRSRRKV